MTSADVRSSTTPGVNSPGSEIQRYKADAATILSTRPSTPRWWAREDLWHRYPAPSANFRPTMFGLPLDAYRAEYRRRQAEGWQRYELELRFPAPTAVTR